MPGKNAHDLDHKSHLARPRRGPINQNSQAFYEVSECATLAAGHFKACITCDVYVCDTWWG